MKELWYFEQRSMGGGWSPCTSENQPVVRATDGINRLRGSDGASGPRVRRICKVPEKLMHLPLGELSFQIQKVLSDV
jgi:hypothetical protein